MTISDAGRRAGAAAMGAYCVVIFGVTVAAVAKLWTQHGRTRQVLKRHAFQQRPTSNASLLHHEIMWGIMLSDMALALTSAPAFLMWVAEPLGGTMCYWQASTSVACVATSVLCIMHCAVERCWHIVQLRCMPSWAHYSMLAFNVTFGVGLGVWGAIVSRDVPPISQNQYFCAPRWDDPRLTAFSSVCLSTLGVCGALIIVSVLIIFCKLERRYLDRIMQPLVLMCVVFVLLWFSYMSLMIWQVAHPQRELRDDLILGDAVVTALGFTNSLVNSCVYLFWYSDKGPARVFEQQLSVTSEMPRGSTLVHIEVHSPTAASSSAVVAVKTNNFVHQNSNSSASDVSSASTSSSSSTSGTGV